MPKSRGGEEGEGTEASCSLEATQASGDHAVRERQSEMSARLLPASPLPEEGRLAPPWRNEHMMRLQGLMLLLQGSAEGERP